MSGGGAPAPEVDVALGAVGVTGQHEHALDHRWELASLAPGAAVEPAALPSHTPAWRPIAQLGPVAAVDDRLAPGELDRFDHWYRCRFTRPDAGPGRVLLCFDGLATIADAWLNGRHLLHSESMFVARALDVSATLGDENELVVRFHALAPQLRQRRPRGRWPTRLVSERHLRHLRTTLLGYLPGWWPAPKVAGPWRPIRLVTQERVALEEAALDARLDGESARLSVRLRCRLLAPASSGAAVGELRVGGSASALRCEPGAGGALLVHGDWSGRGLEPWWPHTHGDPALHPAEVVLAFGGAPVRIALGPVGFRTIRLVENDADAFRLEVNGEPIFCRGACWTPIDPVRLHASAEGVREALLQVQEGGMNMLRVGGTTVYESDDFYRQCDALGILVWQDFMFANFDYPAETAFLDSCRREALQLLERTAGRACVAVACGGSEVQQQAAMMGLPRDQWSHPLFDEVLAEACARVRPALVYVPSSPSGGDLPFHVDRGPSHYFGVGAYRRPLEDASLAGVRFASECLAFSNVPEDETLDALLPGAGGLAHHPRYKERVPRDPAAGWDFADVTDHYVESLFGVEARDVRASDPPRYLALCRAATAEVMAAVQHRWRPRASGCGGALVWLLRDPWAGAGWGIVDAGGVPKSPYYALRRAWAPVAAWIVDDGLNGLRLHLANDTPHRLRGELRVELYRGDGTLLERAALDAEVGPRSEIAHGVEALLGHFADASYAYRFGPPGHELVHARWECAEPDGSARTLATAFHFRTRACEPARDLGLSAVAEPCGGDGWLVTARAERPAFSVAVEAPGHRPTDAYFHLAPRHPHRFLLRPLAAGTPLRARLRPLNASSATPIEVRSRAEGRRDAER